MKKTTFLYLALAIVMIGGCKKEKEFDYGTIHVYNPEEIQKFIDHAVKIEMKGEPTVQRSDNPTDSSTLTTTTQTYLVYVNVTEDGNLVPKGEETTTARMGHSGGPIVVTTACTMSCKMVGTDRCSDAQGCMPNGTCGCTQGSCGSACTTTVMCRSTLSGFGFGGPIRM